MARVLKNTRVEPVGNKAERETFDEVSSHYDMSKADLDVRITDFDKKDELFRSFIDEANWPYRSLVSDPRIFTALIEKGARMFANKPRGRMTPREGGDALGAMINNEVLSFQWDDSERVDSMPMLAKWAMMDLNARKYGASFGLVPWHYQRMIGKDKKGQIFYDGPNLKPWNNRDVLVNPSYSSIKNWIQLRGYPTFQELESVNDAARSKPVYKNLDILRDQMRKGMGKKGGDHRQTNYQSKNKTISGLTDYLGSDEVFRTIEMITEYRDERWITFAPRYGTVVRDIANPYDHGQIPVVMLKYYCIDDDIYGLSEIESVEKLQRAVNALICQYLDAINMSLYTPLKINSAGGAVQMQTINFGPAEKWLMQNPQTDVLPFEQSLNGVQEFTSTYRFLISALQEGLGETSQGISNLSPGGEDKTATEIRDLAVSRNARDNFNQIYLSEAMKKQMMLWYKMNQQFFFNANEKEKIIQITGKDSIAYFQQMGLDGEGMTDKSMDLLSNPEFADIARPTDLTEPLYPVAGHDGMIRTKLRMEEDGQSGSLTVEPGDLSGLYDYVPDIESMKLPDSNQMIAAGRQIVEMAVNPQVAQILAGEGYKFKAKEALEDYFEKLGYKDADKYFDKLQQQPGMPGMMGGVNGIQGQINSTGAGGIQQGGMGNGNGSAQGLQ